MPERTDFPGPATSEGRGETLKESASLVYRRKQKKEQKLTKVNKSKQTSISDSYLRNTCRACEAVWFEYQPTVWCEGSIENLRECIVD